MVTEFERRRIKGIFNKFRFGNGASKYGRPSIPLPDPKDREIECPVRMAL